MSRRTRLAVTVCEDRTVPAIVINGTAGNDTITSQIAPLGGGLYHADILVNGAVVYSFENGAWPYPVDSVYLPDVLELNALGGNDVIDLGFIRGPGGSYNTIHGGPGNDTIKGTYGHDTVYGDAGADRLNGGVDEDFLVGDAADLAFDGGGGVDVLRLDNFAGNLKVTNDYISMNGNKLTAASGKFNSILGFQITGSNGDDNFDLGDYYTFLIEVDAKGGDDFVRVQGGRGFVLGGNGSDKLVTVGTGGDYLYLGGGKGDDRLTVAQNVIADGGDGNDTLDARGIPVSFYQGTANLSGGAGADVLYGGPGGDTLDGGTGADKVVGGGGGDQLAGGPGADELIGGKDDDVFVADADDDRWAGGGGTDDLTISDPVRTVTVTNTAVTIDGNGIPASSLESITLTGTAKADTFDAGKFAGRVRFYGLAGNDKLTAGAGGGTLDGGDGNDTLTGGAGNEELYGGPGIDRLAGNGGDDALDADVTDAALSGGPGIDSLYLGGESKTVTLTDTSLTVNGTVHAGGGFEAVALVGSAGDDVIDAVTYSGSLIVQAGDGNDFVRGGSGGLNVDGGAGNDTLTGGTGIDQLGGGDGADALAAGDGDDILIADAADTAVVAGDGYDQVEYYSGASLVVTATAFVSDGVTVPTGAVENLFIHAPDGDDTIDTTAFPNRPFIYDQYGTNTFLTGPGGSVIIADDATSTLIGGDGPDAISSYMPGSVLSGGGGDDGLYGSPDSTFDGGPGTDVVGVRASGVLTVTDTQITYNGVVSGFTGVERLDVQLGETDDTLDASAFSGYLYAFDHGGYTTVFTGSGGSEVYLASFNGTGGTVYGGSGNDRISAGVGNSFLYGGDGTDYLIGGYGDTYMDGGSGDDRLEGYTGNDTLIGGTGLDVLLGGAGADTFYEDADPVIRAQEVAFWDFNAGDGDVIGT